MKVIQRFFILSFLVLLLFGCQDQRIEIKIYNASDELVSLYTLEPGQPFDVLSQIGLEGYEIEGWYVDALRTEAFDPTEDLKRDVSLYPKWNKLSYDIVFEMGELEDLDVISIPFENPITLENPTREGYEFLGWFLDTNLTEPFSLTIMPSHDITLYPKWEILSYTISFESGIDLDIVSDHYMFGENLDLPEPETEGLIFSGWYIDSDYETVFDETTMPAEDLTLYAFWTYNFEIALITDGGQIDDQSFNQIAFEGMLEYSLDLEKNSIYLIPTNMSTQAYLEAIDQAVLLGVQAIIMNGFLFENAAYVAQYRYPDINFILLDGSPHNITDWNSFATTDGSAPDFSINENLVSIFYKEHESGFLAGYSSVKEGFDRVGFVGGMAVPAIARYGIGYIAGAYYAAYDLGLENFTFYAEDYIYTNTFAPNGETNMVANSMYLRGVDSIFTCAGGANLSVFAAAETRNAWAFGFDIDQASSSDRVLNSAVKNADVVIYQELYHMFHDTFYGGVSRSLGVNLFAVGLATDSSSWRFEHFSLSNYELIYQVLQSGSINVPSTTAELEVFISQLGFLIESDLLAAINFYG